MSGNVEFILENVCKKIVVYNSEIERELLENLFETDRLVTLFFYDENNIEIQ